MQRIPTIYGMPKLQAKTLPKVSHSRRELQIQLDHQLGSMMAQEMPTQMDANSSGAVLDATLKPLMKKKLMLKESTSC